jgi:hypothetical protein
LAISKEMAKIIAGHIFNKIVSDDKTMFVCDDVVQIDYWVKNQPEKLRTVNLKILGVGGVHELH